MKKESHTRYMPATRRPQKRRARNRFRRYLPLLCLFIAIVLGWNGISNLSWHLTSAFQPERETSGDHTTTSALSVNLAGLYSPYAVLVDLDSGEILAGKREDERIYPASLTKIITAVLAAEHMDDPEKPIRLSEDLFRKLYAQDASLAGFLPNEEVCFIDLIYGILLPSGAECCGAIAEEIAGSEKDFVKLMNQKAAELGMKNTNFRNATGLHDSGHYSTVEDISILLQYALKNECFRTIFTTSRYSSAPTNLHPDGITFSSTLSDCPESASVPGGEILGGKTGYTAEAGLCLASLAAINGKEYILVTAGADGDHQTEPFHVLDAVNVYSQL